MKLEINMDFTCLTLILGSWQAYQLKKITPDGRFSKLSPKISGFSAIFDKFFKKVILQIVFLKF